MTKSVFTLGAAALLASMLFLSTGASAAGNNHGNNQGHNRPQYDQHRDHNHRGKHRSKHHDRGSHSWRHNKHNRHPNWRNQPFAYQYGWSYTPYWRQRSHHHRPHRPAPRHLHNSGQHFSGAPNLFGALLGGLAGTQVGKGKGQIAAIIGGTVLGAVLGGEFSKSTLAADHASAQNSLETQPIGQTTSWKNPDTGIVYGVTPTRTYQTSANQYCREYTTKVTIGGREENAFGTACRAPDGSWVPKAN